MKFHNIAFSGHREVLPEDEQAIYRGLSRLIGEEDVIFHTGGAAGFDTIVFESLYRHPYASNILHIPFRYQWKALQAHMGMNATELLQWTALCPICGPKDDYAGRPDLYLFQRRNEHMVDSADELIVYYNGEDSGGTYNAIRYAQSVGTNIVDVREL